MSAILLFLLSVILITMSGALAPGPLLFTNLSNANRWGWKGGLWLSIGHTLIELPLILLISVGLHYFIDNILLQGLTAAIGGGILLIFAGLQINDLRQTKEEDLLESSLQGKSPRHPLIAGLIFSGLNPYFLIWWLTVGAKLILDALLIAALTGVFVMFLAHVWMDYAWLTGTAWLTNKGTNLVGTKGYRALMLVFTVALIYYGLVFCWSAVLISSTL
ncbi:MAG: LysE family transporter [Promethearchaeota archaeon]